MHSLVEVIVDIRRLITMFPLVKYKEVMMFFHLDILENQEHNLRCLSIIRRNISRRRDIVSKIDR